jgi:putative flippase GtrA
LLNLNIIAKIKRNLQKLIRFAVVGSTGALINFSVYYLAVEYLNFSVNLSAIIAFFVSVVNNYILNHSWTFSVENNGNPINFKQFLYYIIGNLQGLTINLIVLNITVYYLGLDSHLLGQILGVISGMGVNFIFAKKIVFSEKLVDRRRAKLAQKAKL